MAFPNSPVNGQIHNEYKYNNGVWELFSLKDSPSFSAHSNTVIELGSSIYFRPAASVVHVKPDGIGSWSNTKYIAPYSGYYYISANISFSNGDGVDDTFYVEIERIEPSNNITRYFELALNPNEFTNSGSEMISSISGLVQLNEGDSAGIYISNINRTGVQIVNFSISGHLVQLL